MQMFQDVGNCRSGAAALLLACGLSVGCGTPEPPAMMNPPQGPCAAVVEQAPSAAPVHAMQGMPLTWPTNPPAEGVHYPVWAPWAQPFTEIVPRGNWMHNAEHGGVILLYRCSNGCPDVAAQLQSFAEALPQDPLCTPPINARWVLTPDPLLPEGVQVAAVAWGHLYRASCFDAATLRPFVDAHYARTAEDFCADGAIAWR